MRNRYDYPDDFFADTKMSFGDHLGELQTRLWAAAKGLMLCMFLGFVLDMVGTQMNWPWFGLGKPVLAIIKRPAEAKMREFFNERSWNEHVKTLPPPANEDERRDREAEREKYLKDLKDHADNDDAPAVNLPKSITVAISAADIARARDAEGNVSVAVQVHPMDFALMLSEAQTRLQNNHALKTMSAQEGFIVYFKVSILCSCILASPWILWQFWAFVGAGMYPHEKAYINRYLPFSLALFFTGIVLCQVFVLPNMVKALLGFNEWLDLEPDLRLNEWLGLALLMPLIFGVSFQTPLVMLALNQIGVFSPDTYLSKWRHALLGIGVITAVVTPTPDPGTWLLLYVPMVGLYFLGWYLCRLFPQRPWLQREIDAAETETVAV